MDLEQDNYFKDLKFISFHTKSFVLNVKAVFFSKQKYVTVAEDKSTLKNTEKINLRYIEVTDLINLSFFTKSSDFNN